MSAGLTKEETVVQRKQLLGPACELFFKHEPLKIVRASKQYLYDENGERYLDCISNVQHVGHCHPEVVKAVHEQMLLSNCNSRFLHDNIILCAKEILSTMPEEIDTMFFCNSGSEANDLAMRIAQDYTKGARDMIVVDHAYHGHLMSTIDISPFSFNGKGGYGKPDHVHIVPVPDVYRGKYQLGDDQLTDAEAQKTMGLTYANEVQLALDKLESDGRRLSAFIMEGLQSCGGQVITPPNYLKQIVDVVHKANGLVIVDEVQTGFGRVGTHFWSFQIHNDGVVPDIVTLGKPMGNGFPVSAVACKRAVANAFGSAGMDYFNTFGGNPVSCAAALAVMKVIKEEKLQENANDVGKYLLESLKKLQQKHTIIGDVRGIGLFAGIDLVTDRKTRHPASNVAEEILYEMKRNKVVLSREGPFMNVLKLKPPMTFSCADVDKLCQTLDAILVNT